MYRHHAQGSLSRRARSARPRLRRRHGHDALREGRLPQPLLRRGQPDAAGPRGRDPPRTSAPARRSRDEHVRRQPRSSSAASGSRTARTRSTCRAARSPAAAREQACVAGADRSARHPHRAVGPRPASTRPRRLRSASRRGRSLEGGVDCFILETFGDLTEIDAAIRAVRSLCALPIVAQMTTEEDGNSLYGAAPEAFVPELERLGADVVGVNCSVGPAAMLEALERMRSRDDKRSPCSPTPARRATSTAARSTSARPTTSRSSRGASSTPARGWSAAAAARRPTTSARSRLAVRRAAPRRRQSARTRRSAARQLPTRRQRRSPPVRARGEVPDGQRARRGDVRRQRRARAAARLRADALDRAGAAAAISASTGCNIPDGARASAA